MRLCYELKWRFFDEQRCVQPRLSRPSFRVCVPWRWIVQCLYELHILSCSKSSFGVVEGKAPHLPLRRCWSCCWIIDADSQKKSVDTEGYIPPPRTVETLWWVITAAGETNVTTNIYCSKQKSKWELLSGSHIIYYLETGCLIILSLAFTIRVIRF